MAGYYFIGEGLNLRLFLLEYKMTPTARTIKYFKDAGCLIEVVERYNSFSGKRKDLFGFIDAILIENDILFGLQITSGNCVPARIKKIKSECKESAIAFLKTGNKILVIGWRKLKSTGRQKWHPRIHEITLEDLQ